MVETTMLFEQGGVQALYAVTPKVEAQDCGSVELGVDVELLATLPTDKSADGVDLSIAR